MSRPSDVLDLDLGLKDTHVFLTGAAGAIGTTTLEAFLLAGAKVTAVDLKADKIKIKSDKLLVVQADISDEQQMIDAFKKAYEKFGVVQTCIALASIDFSYLEKHDSMIDMEVSQFANTHRVNVQGTFITVKQYLAQLKKYATEDLINVGLIIIGSESGLNGEKGNPDYSSGKSAVQVGLMRAALPDIVRIHSHGRVNSLAPGTIDTAIFREEVKANPDDYYLGTQATQALPRPIPTAAIAKCLLFLASESFSGHIDGELLSVNGGKLGKVMWREGEFKGK